MEGTLLVHILGYVIGLCDVGALLRLVSPGLHLLAVERVLLRAVGGTGRSYTWVATGTYWAGRCREREADHTRASFLRGAALDEPMARALWMRRAVVPPPCAARRPRVGGGQPAERPVAAPS